MASHPADPNRVARGLQRPQMDLPAAEAACRSAVAAEPENARSIYQLGRTIYYQGRHQESVPYLQKSADIGYPQAIFVLAYVQTLGGAVKKDYCKAQSLWKRGVGLQHPWSGYHLVENQLNGKFAGCKEQVSDAEMSRFMHLATDRITVQASRGRVEKLSARLENHLAKK
ncbi:hypothetical protein AB1K62_05305 [Parasphingorhabdus sp. JC815]|uniref:hypothetical protein n=1 Tax=Parasphingorhabdus sp. JC815 TaxID=3232140 RepID=UPI00345B0E68